ncbi:MAG: AmmeMemoRadiSam system protein A [Amphritea sp.]
MPSVERYSAADREYLLNVAMLSIRSGLECGRQYAPEEVQTLMSLQHKRACFVTLKLAGKLRGCVGNMEATSRLVDAVAKNTYRAAFEDARFEPVSEQEIVNLTIDISVLTPLKLLAVASNQALIDTLRPDIDGLLFEAGAHRATFLPSVWEQLPSAENFVSHLKKKAGLASDYWSDDVNCWVYEAIKIE